MSRTLVTSCLFFVALDAGHAGADVSAAAAYAAHVKPLLAARCHACHGALKQKADLRLDTAEAIRRGGKSGPAVTPGESRKSLLLRRVGSADPAERMPPEGEPLAAGEIELLRAWIDAGAAAPADEKAEADPHDHWAFRPPVRPAVPSVLDPSWAENPIDAFVAARHAELGLVPQPGADPALLLRRLHFDLLGLPPSLEALDRFVADPSPSAYERIVDELLESPQHGERWARHWMDIWRYSDWWGLGPEVRNSQKHIWRWRDWIVESLNTDTGYDQMLREMLAADELYPDDLDRLRATGFLARHYFKFNRTTWLDEAIEHTSKAFLGLTFNCAKCHDHKYDPFSQTEYYQLRAILEPYQVRTDMVPGELDLEKDGMTRAFDCNLEQPTYLFERGDDRNPVKDRPLAPALPRFLAFTELKIAPVSLPPTAHTPGLRAFVVEETVRQSELRAAAAREALGAARGELDKAEASAAQTRALAAAAGAQTAAPILVRDDFGAARPETWEMVGGEWRYHESRLRQERTGAARAVLRLKARAPRDFEARFRFAITGGDMWKSVGIACDADDGRHEVLVYLSAFAGGPKLQVSYRQDGQDVFPPDAAQSRTVALGEPQELRLLVRDRLLNVHVNGQPAMAYRLPLARRDGHLELVVFDAQAELSGFELLALPAGAALEEAAGPEEKRYTVEQARALVAAASKDLAAAALEPEAVRARAAADRARWLPRPDADLAALARTSALCEAVLAVARAEAEAAKAELEALRAPAAKKAEAEKQVLAARERVIAARKAGESPGETYTPIAGALKTFESNLESEESRRKPFPTTSTGRRSALASWLTDRRHPLTARVAVNHLWTRHFGRPLVPTVFDFGRKGTPPTHPELLDWLAVELMESGWSLKRLHRLIVTSRTYRLSSSAARATAVNLDRDPESRFLWRRQPVRMEAQAIRDGLLAIAGELDLTIGGPTIPAADETSRRRSIYFFHSHNEQQRFLSMFDDASVLECYRRAESIVPQQALALANSKLALGLTETIAARVAALQGTDSSAGFVRTAWRAILCSPPTAEEAAACVEALARFEEMARVRNDADPARRARVGLVSSLLNHNDFVTVR